MATVKKDLLNKEYRDAFVEESVKTGIAFQTRALRLSESWSQKELGEKAGKPQNVISRIEDPDYGNFAIRTLLNLASAFDVALLVRFVSFGQLIQQLKDVSPAALAVPNFTKEQDILGAASKGASQALTAGLREAELTNRLLPELITFGITPMTGAAASVSASGQPNFLDAHRRSVSLGGAGAIRQ